MRGWGKIGWGRRADEAGGVAPFALDAVRGWPLGVFDWQYRSAGGQPVKSAAEEGAVRGWPPIFNWIYRTEENAEETAS